MTTEVNYFNEIGSNFEIKSCVIEEINEKYKQGKLSLCLGSGITARLVGSWNELLEQLTIMRCLEALRNPQKPLKNSAMKNVKPPSYSELHEHMERIKKEQHSELEISTLELGEYLMFDPDDPIAGDMQQEEIWRECFFAAQVRYNLIDQLNKKLTIDDDTSGTIKDRLIRNYCTWSESKDKDIQEKGSSLFSALSAVVKLCVKGKIQNIITYNFDTILDRLLASERVWELCGLGAKRRSVKVYSFYQEGCIPELSTCCGGDEAPICIYHVHGLLDADEVIGVNQKPDALMAGPIIFSENSYLSYQSKLLNWSNHCLLDVILKSTLLCYGFSGNDPNFRLLCRLFLETSRTPIFGRLGNNVKELPRIYLLKSYEKIFRYFELDKPDAKGYVFTYMYMSMMETYYLHLFGISILWSENHHSSVKVLTDLAEGSWQPAAKGS